MSKIGRNDPCWCGSGKKYKTCHFAEDQRKAAERMKVQQARMARLHAFGVPSDSEMRGMYEEMTGRNIPAGPLPADARQMLTELWQQQKLNDQSISLLEPHRAEWESYFADHPDEFETVADEVAKDEFFNDYELTEENTAKVRAELGEPPTEPADLRTYATEAVKLTLDDDDRTNFYDAVMSRLCDYTDKEDWKTAYVVATAAEQVKDKEAAAHPFLRDVILRSLANQPVKA